MRRLWHWLRTHLPKHSIWTTAPMNDFHLLVRRTAEDRQIQEAKERFDKLLREIEARDQRSQT